MFKQKSLSFEKMSETMQGTCPSHEPSSSTIRTYRATEIVKFREMLEERLAAKESPLPTVPDEHKPVIAKLVHERYAPLCLPNGYVTLTR